MVRDLTEMAVGMVRQEQRQLVETQAKERVVERLVDLLLPSSNKWDPEDAEKNDARQRSREKIKAMLEAGKLEERTVELNLEQKVSPVQILGSVGGMEHREMELQSMLER